MTGALVPSRHTRTPGRRTRTASRARTLRCGLVVCAALLLVGQPRADADSDWLQIEVVGGGPLRFDALAPGICSTQELILVTATAGPTRLYLSLTDVAESENRCLVQEQRAGDACDEDGGELLPSLTMRVERLDGTAPLLVERRLMDLTADRVDLGMARPGSPLRLRLSIWPDRSAANDTMTDSVRFEARWAASGMTAVLPAQGVAGGPGGPFQSVTGSLPDTGAPVGPTHLGVAIALLVGGVVLLRRRTRTSLTTGETDAGAKPPRR